MRDRERERERDIRSLDIVNMVVRMVFFRLGSIPRREREREKDGQVCAVVLIGRSSHLVYWRGKEDWQEGACSMIERMRRERTAARAFTAREVSSRKVEEAG